MKTVKQQIIIGGLLCLFGGFEIVGLIVITIWLFQTNQADYKMLLLLLFGAFGALILWAGTAYLQTAYREYYQKQAILKNGKTYMGKIKGYSYEQDESKRHQASGKFPLILTVRYLNENGDIREINVATYKYEQSEFPLTYNVPFKLYKGMAVLTGAATDRIIQGEDELLLDGMDVKGSLPTVLAICPNCGGEVKIPVGKGAKCVFCGMILRTDQYGQVIRTR